MEIIKFNTLNYKISQQNTLCSLKKIQSNPIYNENNKLYLSQKSKLKKNDSKSHNKKANIIKILNSKESNKQNDEEKNDIDINNLKINEKRKNILEKEINLIIIILFKKIKKVIKALIMKEKVVLLTAK